MLVSKTDFNRYLNHATSSKLLNFYLNNGGKTQVMSLPICPKCEKIGFRDKGWATEKTMVCPVCGYRGPATHQLSAFLKDRQYK